LEFSEKINRAILDEHLNELEVVREKRSRLLREIRDLSKDVTTLQLLRSIPGVGSLTAFILFTELADIHRFRNLDHLCSFIGLVPSTSSSGSTERINGITNRQNKYLRSIIIESAWIAVRKDPALTAAYNDLIKRLPKQRAIVRIAKKLTNRIRYVWLHQTQYVPAVVE
jgi:transposase